VGGRLSCTRFIHAGTVGQLSALGASSRTTLWREPVQRDWGVTWGASHGSRAAHLPPGPTGKILTTLLSLDLLQVLSEPRAGSAKLPLVDHTIFFEPYKAARRDLFGAYVLY